ncbi:ANTAR domain-containing response regulator [Anaerotruncus massiliensis (ex Togo et al. 2019)]|uniref:ANTAR domain-containing response regulator n=1 Tax=Anaerotruncus massiliensis (ex Togo et al. 2019) TaxID=1673720 RepID=UPI001FA90DD6|nr:ANTAR domain-containing protein [Anaerotruncus massiliensis (ex Togo et al. 2019)]
MLVNTPLPDEFGSALALETARESDAGVALLVNAPQADAVSAEVEDFGVFVVEKPFSRPMLFQSLRLVLASRRRMLGLQRENVRLNEKLEELRLVSRAKGALMRVLGMTEPQAHHYIEKQAMDLRATRREVARRILGACDE